MHSTAYILQCENIDMDVFLTDLMWSRGNLEGRPRRRKWKVLNYIHIMREWGGVRGVFCCLVKKRMLDDLQYVDDIYSTVCVFFLFLYLNNVL